MKVTRAMKDYVEEQVGARMEEVIKPIEEEFNIRYKKCIAELEVLCRTMNEEARKILAKYDMDIIEKFGQRKGIKIFSMSTYQIDDSEKSKKINNIKNRRDKMIKEFYLNCDLGVNKEEFLRMVDEMRF